MQAYIYAGQEVATVYPASIQVVKFDAVLAWFSRDFIYIGEDIAVSGYYARHLCSCCILRENCKISGALLIDIFIRIDILYGDILAEVIVGLHTWVIAHCGVSCFRQVGRRFEWRVAESHVQCARLIPGGSRHFKGIYLIIFLTAGGRATVGQIVTGFSEIENARLLPILGISTVMILERVVVSLFFT